MGGSRPNCPQSGCWNTAMSLYARPGGSFTTLAGLYYCGDCSTVFYAVKKERWGWRKATLLDPRAPPEAIRDAIAKEVREDSIDEEDLGDLECDVCEGGLARDLVPVELDELEDLDDELVEDQVALCRSCTVETSGQIPLELVEED